MAILTALIKNTKMLLVKNPIFPQLGLGAGRYMSKFVGSDQEKKEIMEVDDGQPGAVHERSRWLPHPRSGIYFPEGHEWVMDGVPDNAATFDRTVWLRTTDELLDHKPYDHN